jgi:uncharacterized membrane protein
MNQPGLLLLLIALVAANVPFLSERVLFVLRPKGDSKAFGWRALEWLLLYFVVGGVARLLESRLNVPQVQKWEFYAITFCLFLVLAYPGFVYRYLWRHR